jgi:hypothetical protein
MVWQQRNDSVQGYIYLLKAKDFHGWIPGRGTRTLQNRIE